MASLSAAPAAAPTMEVLVGPPDSQGSVVQAVLTGGERAQATLAVDGHDPELATLLARVQTRSSAEPEIRRLGSLLFDGLFNGEVAAAYREARGRARAQGMPLRLLLTAARADVAALPWELLYDPWLRHYLVLTPDIRLARNLVSARPVNAQPPALPLRLLLAYATPRRFAGVPLAPLDVDAERRLIRSSLEPLSSAGLVEPREVHLRRPDDLTRAMSAHRPHIVHYIGHSGIWHGTPMLACGDGGEAQGLPAARLAGALGAPGTVQLCVLNSCWSGQLGVQETLFGLAPAIADAGVPAVIGWQTGITDHSAPWLAARLYETLARGALVDDAVAATRLALHVNEGVEPLAWGLVVLYLRQQTTRLIAPPVRTWRLLVIDDEAVRADLLRSRLGAQGIEVIWAVGGAEGVALAPQLRPDVVILDLKMPGMDGFEVLRRLRLHPLTADIPVVVLSALGFDYDVALMAYIGGARYVIPYNGRIDQLEQILYKNLGVPLR